MNKIFLSIAFLLGMLFTSSASALELCEYNDIKTTRDRDDIPGSLYLKEEYISIRDKHLISNLEQIEGLICVQYADFYNSGLTGDFSSLANLVNIEYLSLHTNPDIQGDICALSGATKLRNLKLAFNPKLKGDISCLKNINLETFAMSFTNISGDLSGLSHMTKLKELYLSGTAVSGDISALSGLTNLEQLVISDTAMTGSKIYGDLSSLDNLQNLKKVALYNMDVTNCKHFTRKHPNIEQGGCSDESRSGFNRESNNKLSEDLLGLGGFRNGGPNNQHRYEERFDFWGVVIAAFALLIISGIIIFIIRRRKK